MTYLKIGGVVAFAGLVILASCSQNAQAPLIRADTADIDAFATQVLNDIQPTSIAEGREYCGYILTSEQGNLFATAPAPGGEDYCDLPWPGDNVVASYHTHGGFSDLYDNEVPSVDDMIGDFEAGTDGYVSTPGGRVWLIDYDAQIARQLCNALCVTSDPENDPTDAGFVPQTFTLDELKARFE